MRRKRKGQSRSLPPHPNGEADGEERQVSSKLSPQLQKLWFLLARQEWASLVVIPAHDEGSTADLACSLADIGSSLSEFPVSAVTASELDSSSTRTLVALAQQVKVRQKRLWQGGGNVIDVTPEPDDEADDEGPFSREPTGQLIISVPPVASAPAGLAIADVADLIVIGVELGKTRTEDLSKTVELVGRDRVAGCILL